jgi:hypothetical protein
VSVSGAATDNSAAPIMFGPMGILAFICPVWFLETKSVVPQFFLVFWVVAILLYRFFLAF